MLLGVNVDHIATVRNARGGMYPSPVLAAQFAQDAGADSIVMHLREDRRHIRDEDVHDAKKRLAIPLNLEMSLNAGIVDIAVDVRPAKATIVPERRKELTTEGGLDVVAEEKRLCKALMRLFDADIDVSLFVSADKKQIKASYDVGVRTIELHTGSYAEAKTKAAQAKELTKLKMAAEYAHKLGMTVAAGHGLNLDNIKPIVAIAPIVELNIGHSIVSEALFVGLEVAVADMKAAIVRKR
jgi:pyridoxine 5-phosphate synthase